MSAYELIYSDNDLVLKNKYGMYSKSELSSQLKEGHFTVEELGGIYSLKPYQIRHVLKCLGVLFSYPLNDTRVLCPRITPGMHQVLLGTLAGDGYLKTPKSYRLGHSLKQVAYSYHVSERLHPFVSSIGMKLNESIDMWTYSHSAFIPYFERFYSRGSSKKFFIEDTLKDIEAEGLAYWFMDDGKYSDYGYYLCVGKITKEEGCILIRLLKDKFNLEVTFQAHHIVKRHYNLYIKACSRNTFLELIEPYLIPSMYYKIGGKKVPPPNKEGIISLHKSLCVKASRQINFFGDDDIKHVLSAGVDVKGFKEVYKDKIRKDMLSGYQISKTDIRIIPSDTELKKYFDNGKTDQDVADRCGFSRNRIAVLRRKLGIKRKVCRGVK